MGQRGPASPESNIKRTNSASASKQKHKQKTKNKKKPEKLCYNDKEKSQPSHKPTSTMLGPHQLS
jgi:hypothetical protein